LSVDLSNPIKPWENVIWTPEPLFKGETVVCLASGPSLTQEICDRIRDAECRTIVVNSSCMLAPWADVLYFTDSGWYDARKELVANWPGLVVSMSRQAKRELDTPEMVKARGPRILRVKGAGDPSWPPRLPGMPKRLGFPPVGSPEIHQGRNSGNTAVSLAIAMGASRVLLVGYDCQLVNGREHHHEEYKGPRDLTIYDLEFRHAFRGWNEAAQNSGVEILNCTHGSAITEFPFADLDEVLACFAR
jgi:hypothetical protein